MRHQSNERATLVHEGHFSTVAFLVSHGMIDDESQATWGEGQGKGGDNVHDLVSSTDQREDTSNMKGLYRQTV